MLDKHRPLHCAIISIDNLSMIIIIIIEVLTGKRLMVTLSAIHVRPQNSVCATADRLMRLAGAKGLYNKAMTLDTCTLCSL